MNDAIWNILTVFVIECVVVNYLVPFVGVEVESKLNVFHLIKLNLVNELFVLCLFKFIRTDVSVLLLKLYLLPYPLFFYIYF